MSSVIDGLNDFFTRGNPFGEPRPAKKSDIKKAYTMRTSFTDLLPWLWHNQYKKRDYLLLDDGRSYGAVIQVSTVPTEALDQDDLVDVRDALQRVLSDAMIEHPSHPWVVQVYGYRDESYTRNYIDEVRAYARKQLKASGHTSLPEYSEWYFNEVLAPHLDDLSSEHGLFTDPMSEASWAGCQRQVLLCIYRRHGKKPKLRRGQTTLSELDEQVQRVIGALAATGLSANTLTAEQTYNWLFRWFHPAPANEHNTEAKLAKCPYPCDADKPADWTLAEAVCTEDIRSDNETQWWYFDGKPHAILNTARLNVAPKIGQLSGEQTVGEQQFSPLDKLPPGSRFVVSLVIQAQHHLDTHLDLLERGARGTYNSEADYTRENVKIARDNKVRGNKLYPYQLGVFLRGDTDEELDTIQTDVIALLNGNGLDVIQPEFDPIQLDSYIRFLPFSYNPKLDQVKNRRGLIYAQHAANLIPVYGRARGSGNPGILQFNRGGEPFTVDPLNQQDRSRNGHLFLFGGTGAGKSATLTYLVMHYMAVHRPRIIMIEAGNSFGLLTKHFADKGLKTRDISLKAGCGTSLPPFNLALELVDNYGNVIDAGEVDDHQDDDTEIGDESNRDILAELTIVAQIMVTGGDASHKLSRVQLDLLQRSILRAASAARKAGQDQLMTDEVIAALESFIKERPDDRKMIQEMTSAMRMFTRGLAGELFNRRGTPWDNHVDFTRIDLASLANEGNADKLMVAYVGLINSVLAMAERTQRDGRPTLLITDEAHILTKIEFTASYLVLYIKLLGRRLGLWFWMATQNMEDFKGEARKMLAMFEWWLLLKMEGAELAHLEANKDLTPQQRKLVLDSRKEVPLYAEGVLLSGKTEGLFRTVPPPLPMALAMTEMNEKTERFNIMNELGVSELEAAEEVARKFAARRRGATV